MCLCQRSGSQLRSEPTDVDNCELHTLGCRAFQPVVEAIDCACVAGRFDQSSRRCMLRWTRPSSNELVARVESLRGERWLVHRIERQTALSRA